MSWIGPLLGVLFIVLWLRRGVHLFLFIGLFSAFSPILAPISTIILFLVLILWFQNDARHVPTLIVAYLSFLCSGILIEPAPIPYPFPSEPMNFTGNRWGDTWRSGVHTGITHVHHFFTRRNLWIISKINSLLTSETRTNYIEKFSLTAVLSRAS